MAAGQRDLEAAPRLGLAADLGQVRDRAPARRRPAAPARPGSGRVRRSSPSPTRGEVGRRRAGPRRAGPRSTASRERVDRRRPRCRRPAAPRPRPTGRPRPARSPRRASAATIGRTPGTGRTSPPSDSSPMQRRRRPPPGRTCSDPSRIPTAIARSSEAPALRRSAGARLTVIRRGGWTKPAFRSAPRTRSRASWRAASASPTIGEPGQARGDVHLDPDEAGRRGRGALRTGRWPARRRGYARALTRRSAHPRAYPRTRSSRARRQARTVAAAAARAGLSTARAKCSSDAPSGRIGLREHERRTGVERADRAAVLVHDLVLDRPLERALGVLDVDAGERVRAVEDELDLAGG